MDLKNFLIFCAFLINLFLSILIHLRSTKTKANITFEITAFGITAWCLAMIFFRVSDMSSSILWAKLLYFFPVFIPTAFLLFGLFFPRYKVKNLFIFSIVILNIVMATLTLFGGNVIEDVVSNPGFEKKIIFGWAYYWLYIFYIPGFFIASYIVLLRKFFKENPLVRIQILYILLGMTAASMPAMITNLNLPTFGYFELNWVGQLFTIFWISGVAYAIIKHRLISIKFVVAISIVYILLIGAIAVFYTTAVFIIGNSFVTKEITINQTIFYTFLTIFVAFTFQPLKYYLEKITDRVFFKNDYNSNELLSSLTKTLVSTFRLEELTMQTLNQLFNVMHISKGAFYIFQENNPPLFISGGSEEKNKYDEDKMRRICENKEILILEENGNGKNNEIMQELKISIILPLCVGEKLHGLLLLGGKKSGDIYFEKDIQLLKIFGPEVSVAVENAKAYEEIRKFNITLKEKIDRATKNLQEANNKLQQLDTLKDEFVSLASHELRTPMTVIKSYLWLMLSKNNISSLSEKQKMYIDRAYVSTQRLINLVNDMLNVSRIESGRFNLAMQSLDLVKLISAVYTEMLPNAQEHQINLVFERPLQPLPQVQADPERVEQVLINLIGNSLKFTPANGEIKISLNSSPTEKTVLISIVDSGKGISKEDMPKLFKKFSVLGHNYLQKQNAQGTGLGLYLSKSIIELMGGKIWVESEGEGKGSKFSFTLRTV
ncbi:MAG: ATP-binding protein [Candidatus Levybacteria bacterium]|nr:ATP-binding protein [Candidatus Levybacteria bacterium]